MKKFSCKCGTILNLPENKNISSFNCPNCKRIYKPKKNPGLNQSTDALFEKHKDTQKEVKQILEKYKFLDEDEYEKQQRLKQGEESQRKIENTPIIIFIIFIIAAIFFTWLEKPSDRPYTETESGIQNR